MGNFSKRILLVKENSMDIRYFPSLLNMRIYEWRRRKLPGATYSKMERERRNESADRKWPRNKNLASDSFCSVTSRLPEWIQIRGNTL